MKKILSLVLLCFITYTIHAQASSDVTFLLSATYTNSPASITITWSKVPNVTTYNISRKLRTETTWTVLAGNIAVNDTVYVDNTINLGTGYEYKVSNASNSVTGYIYTAAGLPATHYMGKLLIIVDSSYMYTLLSELDRYETDLIKEGWTTHRIYVGRNETVPNVKQKIKNAYFYFHPQVKGIVLLGHIPVPYSGNIYPDGHTDHQGAWPTDLYYCDTLQTYWTDVSVNNTSATRIENQNIPGDGKFDQSNALYPILYCGRVDMYDMPAISNNDTLLMQNYLNKNHDYRTLAKTYNHKALIDDNFGYFGGEAFAQNGHRNFASLLHPDSVTTGDYFTDMKTNSFLWSYGCGGGWYQGAGGIGNTNNFSSDTIQSVFTILFGSYFGDWDNQNNFLRAPLASYGASLTNCWAGRPNYFFHHMVMGEPIGNSYLETIKNQNTYLPYGFGNKSIHQALLGDPSLKMYPYNGVKSLTVSAINGASISSLNWTAPADTQVIGYYIYRTASLNDSFTLITPNYITNLFYNDSMPLQGKNIYMVRAVKNQSCNGGMYLNLSRGEYDSTIITTPFAVGEQHVNINLTLYPNPATDKLQLNVDDANILNIQVLNVHGDIILEQNHVNNHQQTIQLSTLPIGNYMLKINTNKGATYRKFQKK